MNSRQCENEVPNRSPLTGKFHRSGCLIGTDDTHQGMVLSILGRNTWTIVHEQRFQMGRMQIDYIARCEQHKVCCRAVQDRCNTEQWVKEI